MADRFPWDPEGNLKQKRLTHWGTEKRRKERGLHTGILEGSLMYQA